MMPESDVRSVCLATLARNGQFDGWRFPMGSSRPTFKRMNCLNSWRMCEFQAIREGRFFFPHSNDSPDDACEIFHVVGWFAEGLTNLLWQFRLWAEKETENAQNLSASGCFCCRRLLFGASEPTFG